MSSAAVHELLLTEIRSALEELANGVTNGVEG
jgi:hypothetical protein